MPATLSSSAAPLLGASRGRNNDAARSRQAELAATFGEDSDDDDDRDDDERLNASGFGRHAVDVNSIAEPSSTASSPPRYTSSPRSAAATVQDDVFFDAGDALDEAAYRPNSDDPLGARRVNASSALAPGSHALRRPQPRDSLRPRESSYDFERASYFTPPRPPMSRSASLAVNSPGAGLNDSIAHESHGDVSGMSTSLSGGHIAGDAGPISSVSRVRQALGRFGRFVGMRVPGATYTSLNGYDDSPNAARRRQVVGSGIGQDGVFANLNAKPERRRRRGENGEDRGEDDDLVDEVLPPSYEIAAADSAPPYWETTIIGGPGGFHPLAPGGAGWTPGGAHVGALEDLIVEGLPVGNFFGFAWNLLVSMSFQFIGFLLTYLLHTSHAARCGSRAGLGITLVQYGFYLRTRAAQMAEGKLPEDLFGGGVGVGDNADPLPTGVVENTTRHHARAVASWWSDVASRQVTKVATAAPALVERGLRGIDVLFRQASEASAAAPGSTTPAGGVTSPADALATDNGIEMPSPESMSASTEWLAYILMGLGWFILLTALLSYWRVHRWGRQLVEAARRENESTNADATTGGEQNETANADANAPVGFLHTLRNALHNGNDRRSRRAHSAEDWVIFPGRPRRDLFGTARTPTTAHSGEESQDVDLEAGDMTTEERRLLEDMRSVGLIN